METVALKLGQQDSQVMGVPQADDNTEGQAEGLAQGGTPLEDINGELMDETIDSAVAAQGLEKLPSEEPESTSLGGQEEPLSEQPSDATPNSNAIPKIDATPNSELPLNSKGPQRRSARQPKMAVKVDMDYDFDPDEETEKQKTPRKTHVKKGPAKKTPKRKAVDTSTDADQDPVKDMQQEEKALKRTYVRKTPAKKAADSITDTDQKPVENTPQEEAPKKTLARKTPAKKTPAKRKTPQKKAQVSKTDSEQEPPKKTPRKKLVQAQLETVQADATPAPAALADLGETPVEPETTPGGRPKRRAATVALKYLHNLAMEVFNKPTRNERNLNSGDSPGSSPGRDSDPDSDPGSSQRQKKTPNKAKGRKRKRLDSDPAEDCDFVPEGKDEDDDDEEEEDGESGEDSTQDDLDPDLEPTFRDPAAKKLAQSIQSQAKCHGHAPNGLTNNLMQPVWVCNNSTQKFRDEHCNTWVFPDWIPTEKDWHFLSQSESEKYLPQEEVSPGFMVSREGIKEQDPPLHRLKRFESVPSHTERWDMLFYTGGPVWAIDWCPCPDGANTNEYAAIYCHKRLDDQHKMNETYSGTGLIQIWDLGTLEYNTRPESSPVLAYGLAQDRGCVWCLKWCPGGGWELPTTRRKAPLMPRLGLLAAATSDGQITIYSLPHPEALLAHRGRTATGGASQAPLICQAQAVITLRLGSFKSDHDDNSGQVLSIDWLSVKPHNLMAAGFYDGMVALWDLSSKSVLQRIRSPDSSFLLYPYHCFIAQDNAVRALGWCHASSELLVTAGDDRLIKLWNVRKTYEPITVFKRFLSTEAIWPLHWPGVFVSQENAYAAQGQHGLHYIDSGYLGFRPLFMAPRKGTMWSLSLSDWLNLAVTSDAMGEVIVILLPKLSSNPCYIKRTIERRFPVYFTDMVLMDSPEEEEEGEEMEGGGKKEDSGPTSNGLHKPATYQETANKYYLHFKDNDMRTFKNFQRQAPWKRMQATEVKGPLDMDLLPLASLHKIRFNPNLSAQSWVLSGGQAGLVRAHCLKGMISPHITKVVKECQAQYSAMFSQDGPDSAGDATTVRHTTEQL